MALPLAVHAAPTNGNGFNQFGYNYKAKIFNGTGSSWCQEAFGLAKTTCDSEMSPYQNDQLIMKWNAAWDACNAHGNKNPTYCIGAWIANKWSGMVPGGSGETEHIKVIWVGAKGYS